MAQLAIAATGAVLGSTFGWGIASLGLSGAAVGWAAGSLIGSFFTPTQKSQGPRLDDLKVTGSDYGQVIPWVAGSPRIAGQIVWASNRRETAHTEEVGKGGGGAEFTTYTYDVDLLIVLTDNEISGVSRIWSNGDLIFDGTTTRSGVWSRITVYNGSYTQLPDPTYEAAVGSANAVAYRGRGCVFIEGLQLGNSGVIPNFTFEVGTASVLREVLEIGYLNQYESFIADSNPSYNKIPSQVGPDHRAVTTTTLQVSNTDSVFGNSIRLETSPFTGAEVVGINLNTTNKPWRAEGWFRNYSTSFTISLRNQLTPRTTSRTIAITHTQAAFPNRNIWSFTFNSKLESRTVNQVLVINGQNPYDVWAFPKHSNVSTWGHWVIQQSSDGNVRFYINGHYLFQLNTVQGWHFDSGDITVFETYTAPASLDSTVIRIISNLEEYPAVSPVLSNPLDPYSARAKSYILPVSPYSLDDAIFETIIADGSQQTQPLFYSLPNLLIRSEYSQDDFSVDDQLTSDVRGVSIGQVSSTRSILEILQSAYLFDIVSSDKVYFRPRANDPVVTIPYSDLGTSYDTDDEPFSIVIRNNMELASQISVQYLNTIADYQSSAEYSDRLLSDQDSNLVIQIPIGLTPIEAKAIANRTIVDQIAKLKKTSLKLPIKYAYLEPTDVIIVQSEDGSRQYRLKVDSKKDNHSVIELECSFDAGDLSTLEVSTDNSYVTQDTTFDIEVSKAEILDIPAMRDVDINNGYYSVVTGNGSIDDVWPGAALYQSWDDINYSKVAEFTEEGIIGFTTNILGNWESNVIDQSNTVTVNIGYKTLSSSTRTDILNNNSINQCLIGSEILQFINAELVSDGVYRLSGFIRGQRGTEWSRSNHALNDRFVLLTSSSLKRSVIETSQVGLQQYAKPVTFTLSIASVTSTPFIINGVSLKTFNPVHLRINKDSSDMVLSWVRRTRKQVKYVGTAGIITPLDELSEFYRVKVFNSLNELVRTETSVTNNFIYTPTMQLEDGFTSEDIVKFRVYQLNQVIGEGYFSEIEGII